MYVYLRKKKVIYIYKILIFINNIHFVQIYMQYITYTQNPKYMEYITGISLKYHFH